MLPFTVALIIAFTRGVENRLPISITDGCRTQSPFATPRFVSPDHDGLLVRTNSLVVHCFVQEHLRHCSLLTNFLQPSSSPLGSSLYVYTGYTSSRLSWYTPAYTQILRYRQPLFRGACVVYSNSMYFVGPHAAAAFPGRIYNPVPSGSIQHQSHASYIPGTATVCPHIGSTL
jgi:hypothetical protein